MDLATVSGASGMAQRRIESVGHGSGMAEHGSGMAEHGSGRIRNGRATVRAWICMDPEWFGDGSAWIRNGSAMDLHGLAGPEGWTETGSSESVIGRCDRSWSRAIANGSGDSRERVRQESNGGWRWPSMDSHGSEMVGDGSAWFPDGAAWILNGPGMDPQRSGHGSGMTEHGSAWIRNASAIPWSRASVRTLLP